MKHVVLVGACYLDTILTVPQFPEEDSKLRATSLQVRRGGNGSNTLEVLQQLLGAGTSDHQNSDGTASVDPRDVTDQVALHLMSCLPGVGSPALKKIVASFGEDTRVDFDLCLYRENHVEPASSYIIRSEETGSRTIVNFNDLPEMTVDEFIAKAQSLEEADSWWHFEGRAPETTLQCIRYLRRVQPHSKISVEVEKPGREGLIELAAEADVVFYSRSWAESRGYASAESCLRGESPSRASFALCTWGEHGACGSTLPEQAVAQYSPTLPPGFKVIDAIGAGDTFIAGVLFGLLLHSGDWDLPAKLKFAVDLATSKVQSEGFMGLGPPTATAP